LIEKEQFYLGEFTNKYNINLTAGNLLDYTYFAESRKKMN